jgi:hypothetical protein
MSHRNNHHGTISKPAGPLANVLAREHGALITTLILVLVLLITGSGAG